MTNAVIPAREAQLFVVHIWRHREHFRAAVRRVDADETLLFTTPAKLARYLSAVTAVPADQPQPGGKHEADA